MTTEEMILKTAKRLFYENGFQETTARKLAEECGLVHSTIFYHLESMQNIAFKVMQEYVANSRKVLFDAATHLTPLESFIAYTLAGMRYVHEDAKFENLFRQIPDIFGDAVYENAATEIFPALQQEEVNINDINSVYNYLNMHTLIKSEIGVYELVKSKNLNLNFEQLMDYILLIKKRLMAINDNDFDTARKNAQIVANSIDTRKFNIFI